MNESLIVIPARLESTRLKHKILRPINGKPLLAHVIARAVQARLCPILIAVDHDKTAQLCQELNVPYVMTDPELQSGSDRIAVALDMYDAQEHYQLIINLQADLPTITPEALHQLHDVTKKTQTLTTLVAPIQTEQEKTNPHIVKAAISWQDAKTGRALYFSRHPIPSSDECFYHHIGIYGYPRAILSRFQKQLASPLEKAERLEQLRALEAPIAIYATKIAQACIGIDTEHELEQFRQNDNEQPL